MASCVAISKTDVELISTVCIDQTYVVHQKLEGGKDGDMLMIFLL